MNAVKDDALVAHQRTAGSATFLCFRTSKSRLLTRVEGEADDSHRSTVQVAGRPTVLCARVHPVLPFTLGHSSRTFADEFQTSARNQYTGIAPSHRPEFPIWPGKTAPGSETWTQKHVDYSIGSPQSKLVHDVVTPTLTMYGWRIRALRGLALVAA